MISLLYRLRKYKFARQRIGGTWAKTALRGWIRVELLQSYLDLGFDPIVIKLEKHKEGELIYG